MSENNVKCGLYNLGPDDEKADQPNEIYDIKFFNHQLTDLCAMKLLENQDIKINITNNYVICDYKNSLFGNPTTVRGQRFFDVVEKEKIDEFLKSKKRNGLEINRFLTPGQTNQLINKINDMREDYQNEEIIKFSTKVGFYGNLPGAGKTAVCVALAVDQPTIKEKPLSDFSTSDYVITKISSTIDDQFTYYNKLNLIICPHSIVPQWTKTIKKITDKYFSKFENESDIKFFIEKDIDFLTDDVDKDPDVVYVAPLPNYNIKIPSWIIEKLKNKKFNKINFLCRERNNCQAHDHKTRIVLVYRCNFTELHKVLKQLDFLIVSQKLLYIFTNIFRNIKFLRTFVDEVDQLKFPKNFTNKSTFTWLITATPLKFKLGNTFPSRWSSIVNIYKNPHLFKFYTVKSSKEYIKNSINLPSIKYFHVETTVNNGFLLLTQHISENVINLINSFAFKRAYKLLLNELNLDEDIIRIEEENIRKKNEEKDGNVDEGDEGDDEEGEGDDEEGDEEEEEDKEEDSVDEKDNITPLLFANIILKTYETNLHNTLLDLENENKKILKNHDKKIESLKISINNLKKSIRDINKIILELKNEDGSLVQNNSKNLFSNTSKEIALYQILEYLKNNKENLKILAFSNSRESKILIERVANEINITCANLKGSSKAITNILKKFKEGTINLLLLDSLSYGHGLDIEMTEYLIYFNRLEKREEQMDGRGQRPGRINQLKVVNLINKGIEIPRQNSVCLQTKKDLGKIL